MQNINHVSKIHFRTSNATTTTTITWFGNASANGHLNDDDRDGVDQSANHLAISVRIQKFSNQKFLICGNIISNATIMI